MIESSRRIGIPLVGHAPVNLGIDEMLQAQQSIAHVGMLNNIYFLPFSSHTNTLLVTVVAALILIGLALTHVVAAVLRRGSKNVRGSESVDTVNTLSGVLALITAIAFICAFTYLPGGPLFDSIFLRLVFTAVTGVMVVGTLAAGFYAIRFFVKPWFPSSGRCRYCWP
jgi:amino acid transporter